MSKLQELSPRQDLKSVLYDEQCIQRRVAELGAQLTQDYAGKDLLLICILRGSLMFSADLLKVIELPCEVDFMAVSSYGDQTKSSGVVRILKDLDTDISGKDVLIVEDILDTGLTLSYLRENLASRKPQSLKIATLLLKEGKQKTDIEADYVGFVCPDEFVVGYGLDYAEKYRNLPCIGVLKPEVYL